MSVPSIDELQSKNDLQQAVRASTEAALAVFGPGYILGVMAAEMPNDAQLTELSKSYVKRWAELVVDGEIDKDYE